MHGGGQKRRLAHPQHVRNDERQHVAMDVSERIRRIDRLDLATAVCWPECARTIDWPVIDFWFESGSSKLGAFCTADLVLLLPHGLKKGEFLKNFTFF